MPEDKKKKLTPKQARFIEEYIVDLNATQAAVRAGYSPKTAFCIGIENLKKPLIKKHLAERQREIAGEIGISQKRVLEEYSKLAFFDPRKLYDKNGEFKPVHELEAEVAAALTSIKEKEGEKEYKYGDKKGALDSLAKHLGLFKDEEETKGVTINIVMNVPEPDREDS